MDQHQVNAFDRANIYDPMDNNQSMQYNVLILIAELTNFFPE